MIDPEDFTVANTITVGMAIYKQNLKKFLQLSLKAHLWLLIPVYGWARYCAIAAWISRLSLNELVEQPDNIDQEEYFTLSSLFIFLFTAFIIILITIVCYFSVCILFILIAALLQIILDTPLVDNISEIAKKEEGIAFWLFGWSIILLFSLTSTFFYVRLFLTDLSFTGSHKDKLFNLISRSCSLTKNNKFKVFKIIWISSILSFSLYVAVYIFFYLINFISYALNLDARDYIYYVNLSIFLVMLIAAHGLVLPFWQSVKAVTFYSLNYTKNEWSLR